MDYNLFGTVKRIWALGKCAIEINYLLLLLYYYYYYYYYFRTLFCELEHFTQFALHWLSWGNDLEIVV